MTAPVDAMPDARTAPAPDAAALPAAPVAQAGPAAHHAQAAQAAHPVQAVLGWPAGEGFDAMLDRVASAPAWRPFDPRATAFVERFAQRLLADRRLRAHPELVALGHWFRAVNVRRLAAAWRHEAAARDAVQAVGQAVQLGRGMVFTIAPANVDAVFMYSCLLSLLAGNANVVRVSGKPSPALDRVVEALAATLAEPGVGDAVARRIVLLRYGHDADVTRAISARCQVRMVWGGNATVAAVRAIALRPTAVELCFPDRHSAAALQALAVAGATQAQLDDLARRFADDALQFGQQACSSPRWLAWVGTAAVIDDARALFWPAVERALRRRGAAAAGVDGANAASDVDVFRVRAAIDTGAAQMDRLHAAFMFAAGAHAHPAASCHGILDEPHGIEHDDAQRRGGLDAVHRAGPGNGDSRVAHDDDVAALAAFPQRLWAEHGLDDALRDGHGGQGLFIEQRAPTLAALAPGFSDRDQTLAVHGFSRAEIEAFVAALPPRSVDRIVPVGQALAFAPVWDGSDLVTAFTRRLQVDLPD